MSKLFDALKELDGRQPPVRSPVDYATERRGERKWPPGGWRPWVLPAIVAAFFVVFGSFFVLTLGSWRYKAVKAVSQARTDFARLDKAAPAHVLQKPVPAPNPAPGKENAAAGPSDTLAVTRRSAINASIVSIAKTAGAGAPGKEGGPVGLHPSSAARHKVDAAPVSPPGLVKEGGAGSKERNKGYDATAQDKKKTVTVREAGPVKGGALKDAGRSEVVSGGIGSFISTERDLQRAEDLRRSGDFEEAAVIYRAVWLKTGDVRVANNLGAALLAVGRPQEAADVLKEALKKAPEDEDIKFNLGLALERLDQMR